MRQLWTAGILIMLFVAGSLLGQLTQTGTTGSGGGGGGGAVTQSGIWSTRGQDGAGNPLASSAVAPSGTEQALVTRNIPSGTQPISGSVTANAGSGNFSVVQPTASNLNATVTGTVGAAQSGAWTVQPGNTANTTPWLASISQGGNTALVTSRGSLPSEGAETHGATGTSLNPTLDGCVSISHGANPAAVAANALSRCYSNRAGVPWVMGGHPNVITRQFFWTSAQTDAPVVAISSGLKAVVTRASVTCSRANTVDGGVRLGFGAAALPAPPANGASSDGILLAHEGVAAGSGVVEGVGSGILGVGADGEDLRITTGASTGGSCSAIVSFYTIES